MSLLQFSISIPVELWLPEFILTVILTLKIIPLSSTVCDGALKKKNKISLAHTVKYFI